MASDEVMDEIFSESYPIEDDGFASEEEEGDDFSAEGE